MQSVSKKLGGVCAIVGGQWGDEGKGKLVDILAAEYDITVRATGGANAGHTIYLGDKKFVFHLIPAGMLHKKAICVIGNGTVVHLPTLLEEIEILEKAGIKVGKRLLLSDRSHLVFDYHKRIDGIQEEMKGSAKVGTTGRGIGPAYTDKIGRSGIRMGELLNFPSFEMHYRKNLELHEKMYSFTHDALAELKVLKKLATLLGPMIIDTTSYLGAAERKGKTFLLEGANGALLDVDHGTYPFVTSSNATIGGIVTGTGVPPTKIESVIGIMKAYCTRVGSGPFPTELLDAIGENLRKTGAEFGATTGRPRRCGWFDAVAAKYSVAINGLTGINLTKVDVLNLMPHIPVGVAYKYKGKRIKEFPSDIELLEKCTVEYKTFPGWQSDISGAHKFSQLPKNCRDYILALENMLECPIQFIGVGRDREQMIERV